MKVLLVVIDASPRVVCPAIQTGQLRHLKRLADAGSMHQSSVSIFPSITPAATPAIVTGAYPAENGIAGASWYDPERREVANYGDDFWVIAKKGFGAPELNGDPSGLGDAARNRAERVTPCRHRRPGLDVV